jgi:hypothetical protein
MPIPGASYLLDRATGRVIPVQPDSGGQSDGLILVTGIVPADPGAVILALNQAAAVALPIAGKYTVNYQALQAAIASGGRIVLTAAS